MESALVYRLKINVSDWQSYPDDFHKKITRRKAILF